MTTASSLLTGAVTAVVIACAGLSAATAAPLSAPVKITAAAETKISDAGPETTSALPKVSEDEPACERSRKRLWVEGEGWVVRRVTTCR
ncbi:MAG TPA: hypothetical protein VIL65_14055 [Beijerinckiaceae bacterium]